MTILRVALDTPLRRLFDYLPSEPDFPWAPGLRVLVPFGKTERLGVIAEIATHSEWPLEKLKSIKSVLDKEPLFNESLLKLISWAGHYYHCGLGEIFNTALPLWLRKTQNSLIVDPTPLKIKKPDSDTADKMLARPVLNESQEFAVNALVASLSCFKVFLLDGVTGSGKTEVYMRAIEACLQQGKQALILVPEIGLTPQMLNRFEKRFKVQIVVLHSSMTEKKRFAAWQLAKIGSASIIIGTRSAAFTPLKNPGIFIIDEEHDASFKQQDHFRYSGRDLLIMRASLEQCPIVLGSASPSLETLHNANTGRYTRLQLPVRAGNAQPPEIFLIDIRHKKLDEGLSAQLIKYMQDSEGQTLLFLNRRGFAPVLMCFDCGFVANCKQCDARLTYHFHNQKLKCHHCESTLPLYINCPTCQSNNLNPLGIGTERLETALKQYFPKKEILRIDRDTTRKKGSLEEILLKIENNDADILLGTQMIAKGHHFPNVTLVGIIDIDQALFSLDFRSLERLGQLITQVSGRAGRAERLGKVVLQTAHPEHPLLQKLLKSGYAEFAKALLQERANTNLPPFSHQALFRTEAKTYAEAFEFLIKIKKHTQTLGLNSSQSIQHVKILGPVAALMERRQGKYRAQLLFQSENRKRLQNIIQHLIAHLEQQKKTNTLKWSLDIDPIDMF